MKNKSSYLYLHWQKKFQFSPTLSSLNEWQQWKLQKNAREHLLHSLSMMNLDVALSLPWKSADVTWSSDGLQTFPMHTSSSVKNFRTLHLQVWKGRI